MTKAISAVIATIMLLMITVSLIGVFYVFSSTLATQTTASGSAQASQLTAQLSMCMQIDNIIGNQITLRNCGKGVIENKSLVVMMDDIALGASTNTIQEGNSSAVNVSGLWNIPFGRHSLKISNGAAVAQSLVDVQPNRDGLVGSWNFNEGSGTAANDDSGNNNIGTLLPTGSEPQWVNGKFGNGLQFDGMDDYVNANGNISRTKTLLNGMTISAWIKSNSTAVSAVAGQNRNSGCSYFCMGGLIINYVSGKASMNIFNNTAYIFASSSTTVNDNQWHNLIGVYNISNYTEIYVDGKKEGNSFSGDIYSAPTKNFTIGRHDTLLNSLWFNGTIDEVRIWNRALAPDETVTMKQII